MRSLTWDRVAIILGCLLGFAGVMHFVHPSFLNDIVPPWLPPNQAFWTYLSGAVEIITAVLILRPSTRRTGALVAVALFIGVYPANLYMAWDWRHEALSQQLIAYGRLPFQFLFVWVALRVARANDTYPYPV